MTTERLGQRRTPQREAVYDAIREAAGPLTIPEIHERAQARMPGIGIATVYRTVNLLQTKERIQEVILPTGETRYEMAGLGHHHHFHCRVCDEVFDLEHCPVDIPDRSDFSGGFQVESHEVTLYGVCPDCA